MSDRTARGGLPFVRIEDDVAVFEWEMTDTRLGVRVTNRSSRRDPSAECVVVLMDRAEYVDPDGEAHDLVPREEPRSHIVAPGETRVYSMFPADYMGTGRGFWWPSRALFEGPVPHRVVDTPQGIRDEYKGQVGTVFRIRLPVRVGVVVYQYEFTLTVSDVEPHHARELF